MSFDAAFHDGLVAIQAGKGLIARLQFEQATEHAPECAEGWLWLAWISDKPEQAYKHLLRAQELAPKNQLIDAYLNVVVAMKEYKTGHDYATFRCEADPTEQLQAEQLQAEQQNTEQIELKRAAAAFEFIASKASSIAGEIDEDGEPDELDTTLADVQELEEDVRGTLGGEAETAEQLIQQIDPKSSEQPHQHKTQNAEQATDTPNSASESINAPGTILVVDDSPTVRKIVTMTLESEGYKVVSAEDGVEATKFLVNFSPNLILLDITMPRMGGYKLCKLIKAHPDTSSIPVVMLSGNDGLFDKLRGKLVGCNDYISKPFESAELLKRVREHVNMSIAR